MENKNQIDWEAIRKNYPVLSQYTYLNIASSGPISKHTHQQILQFHEDQLNHAAIHRQDWIDVREKARKKAASLLGSATENIGFTVDVSSGINQIAERIPKNKQIVLIEGDFPSVNLPWTSRGFQIDWVKKENDRSISIERIKKAIGKGSKLLALSWVQYSSGFTIDLDLLSKICQETNTILLVDATQGLCNIPLDISSLKIDVLLASSFKWQAAGYGICIYYESPSLIEKLEVLKSPGWNSLKEFDGSLDDKNLKSGAKVIESGHPKYLNFQALNSSLKEFENIGYQHIYGRISQLRNLLYEALKSLNLEFHSPIGLATEQSSIICIKATKEMFDYLNSKKIMTTMRDDYIRISIHFFNNEQDILTLKKALEEFKENTLQ